MYIPKTIKIFFIVTLIQSLSSCGKSSDNEIPPDSPPVVSLSVNPASIDINGSSILSWSTTNTSSCTASGDWSGVKTVTGSEIIGSIIADSNFTLTCTGSGGSASDNATVTVNSSTPTVPSVTVSASPTSVDQNGSSTLNWSTSNASSCTASGDWSGVKTVTGSEIIGSIITDSNFTLTCTGSGGSASDNATVTVNSSTPAAPSVTLSASPTSVDQNGSSTLSWSTSNATSCTASGDWSGIKSINGSEAIDSISTNSSYTLTCSGTGGSASDSTNITVNTGIVKAFPTAEGFGANATGGRNGQVVIVSNLNTSGSGSLQEALDMNITRIIVFEVSGIIEGDHLISHGDLTIAGQTAPGAGITIHGRLECMYNTPPNNIIIRHIRVRADHTTNPSIDGNQYDGIQCSRSSNLIFDHISLSGGVDENFDLYEADDVTVQWSTITRADPDGGHYEPGHNYGLINGPNGNRISLHHNLFAHNSKRNPAIANGPAEIINNIAYNVRHAFIHHNPSTGDFNIIGNYYKQGPNDDLFPFFFDDEYSGSGTPPLSYYLYDNYVDDPDDLVGLIVNPWSTPYEHSSFEYIDWGWDSSVARTTLIHDFPSIDITINDSQINYNLVLNLAGAFPRDVMDLENIQEVKDRTGIWGARIPNDLMQGLTAVAAPQDSDNDGMPDFWESNNGLSNSTADHNTVMPSGYTSIEVYINELADQLIQ